MTNAQAEARAVASLFDDIYVSDDVCNWADVANARDEVLRLLAAKDTELSNLKKEASKFAEWVEDYSNDGHIARAARAFLDKMEGRDV